MFGATALRRKREKERRERAAKSGANRIYPYIKPFGKNTFYPGSNNNKFWEIESLPKNNEMPKNSTENVTICPRNLTY